jgi:hypothetical protein
MSNEDQWHPDMPMSHARQNAVLKDRFGRDWVFLDELARRLPRYRKYLRLRYSWNEVVALYDFFQPDTEAQAVLEDIWNERNTGGTARLAEILQWLGAAGSREGKQ